MNEQQHWTPADDEVVRGALDTLRRDVEALPLADARFVRARGNARRRRVVVVGAASAAAAVAAISFVGYNTLGSSNQGLDLRPAGPSSTGPSSTGASSTATGPSAPLAAPGPLLVAAEWRSALGINKTVQLGDMRPGEGVTTCVRPPGTQVAIGNATTPSSGFYGVQGTYRALSADAGNTAAAKAVTQLVVCGEQPGQADQWKVEADAAWPKVFSSTTADGKSWFIVAHQGPLTSLLALSDPALGGSKTESPHFSLAQIQALAQVTQQRLAHEVERATAK